jgi:transposase
MRVSQQEIEEAIDQLQARGWGTRRIAKHLNIGRKRVVAILRGEQPDRSVHRQRFAILEPYRERIAFLVRARLTAMRVLEDLREKGYAGGYTVVKEYVRELRSSLGKEATETIEPVEGELMEFDWSEYRVPVGTATRTVYAMSLILVYSRRMVVRFTLRQNLAAILRSIVAGLRYLGAVAHALVTDNHPAMVVVRMGSMVRFHERMRLLGAHYGCELRAARVRRPRDKARVERPFRWLEESFVRGRSFESLEDLNARVLVWVERANARLHPTFGETVAARFERERPQLLSLPADDFDTRELAPRIVGLDSMVVWDANSYSVPPRFVGKTVYVRADDRSLSVEDGGEVIASHEVAAGRCKRVLAPEHVEAIRAARRSGARARRSRREELRAIYLGAFGEARSFLDGLVDTQRGAAFGHLERILALRDDYPDDAILAALGRACRYGAFSAATVARIVESHAQRPLPLPDALRQPGAAVVAEFPELEPVDTADLEDYDLALGLAPDRDAAAERAEPGQPRLFDGHDDLDDDGDAGVLAGVR